MHFPYCWNIGGPLGVFISPDRKVPATVTKPGRNSAWLRLPVFGAAKTGASLFGHEAYMYMYLLQGDKIHQLWLTLPRDELQSFPSQ